MKTPPDEAILTGAASANEHPRSPASSPQGCQDDQASPSTIADIDTLVESALKLFEYLDGRRMKVFYAFIVVCSIAGAGCMAMLTVNWGIGIRAILCSLVVAGIFAIIDDGLMTDLRKQHAVVVCLLKHLGDRHKALSIDATALLAADPWELNRAIMALIKLSVIGLGISLWWYVCLHPTAPHHWQFLAQPKRILRVDTMTGETQELTAKVWVPVSKN